MTAFAATEVSQARLLARQRQEADADGFITVTRGGRTYPARQEAAQEQAAKQNEKQSGLEDFYRFQSREKRKKRAGELARKFAKDKERLRKMRDNRGRFKVSRRTFMHTLDICDNQNLNSLNKSACEKRLPSLAFFHSSPPQVQNGEIDKCRSCASRSLHHRPYTAGAGMQNVLYTPMDDAGKISQKRLLIAKPLLPWS